MSENPGKLKRWWWNLFRRHWLLKTNGGTWDTLGRYTYDEAKRKFVTCVPLRPL